MENKGKIMLDLYTHFMRHHNDYGAAPFGCIPKDGDFDNHDFQAPNAKTGDCGDILFFRSEVAPKDDRHYYKSSPVSSEKITEDEKITSDLEFGIKKFNLLCDLDRRVLARFANSYLKIHGETDLYLKALQSISDGEHNEKILSVEGSINRVRKIKEKKLMDRAVEAHNLYSCGRCGHTISWSVFHYKRKNLCPSCRKMMIMYFNTINVDFFGDGI